LAAEIDLDLFDGVPPRGNEDGVLLDQLGRRIEFEAIEQMLHVAPQYVAVLVSLRRCVEEPSLVCDDITHPGGNIISTDTYTATATTVGERPSSLWRSVGGDTGRLERTLEANSSEVLLNEGEVVVLVAVVLL
jgi:hypothetical protein